MGSSFSQGWPKPAELGVVGLLFFSWATCYLVRDHLFVVATSFKNSEGVSKELYSAMMSVGYLSYFLGKVVFGFAANLLDGRFCMNVTIIGAPVLSWVFAAMPDRISLFVAWVFLRGCQASGWVGMLQIVSAWVPSIRHGRTMSFLSLSFLGGDAVCRRILSIWIDAGMDWRTIVRTASVPVLACAIPLSFLPITPPYDPEAVCKGHVPSDVEAAATRSESSEGSANEETPAAGGSSSAAATNEADKGDMWKRLWKIAKTPNFIYYCVLSGLLAVVRESFNVYGALMLQNMGWSEGDASRDSSFFAGSGAVSTVLFGILIDKMHGRPRMRRLLLPVSSAIGLFAILQLYFIYTSDTDPGESGRPWVCVLIALQGFFVLGAYSTLAGVFALDIGGKECCAVVGGISDACGYSVVVLALACTGTLKDYSGLILIEIILLTCSIVIGGLFMWTAGTNQRSFGIAIPYLEVQKSDTHDSANEHIQLADVQITTAYGRSLSNSQSLPASPLDRSSFHTEHSSNSRHNSGESINGTRTMKRVRSGGGLAESGQ